MYRACLWYILCACTRIMVARAWAFPRTRVPKRQTQSPNQRSAVVLDNLMALLTLLWGTSLAIALASVLVVSLVRWTGGKRSLKTDGRVLLITAHPDDESMFFAPTVITLTQANVEVFLLCLSEGHFILTKYTAKNRCMYTIQPN